MTVIHQGDVLNNPVTRETMIFRRTSAETDGEAVVVETIVEPDGFVAAAHVHPQQSERFEVLEGELGLTVDHDELIAHPGDTVTVRPGTRHRFHNASDRRVRFVMEIKPALGFESLIETMFTLAADGKSNRKGLPNPLRLAVIAWAHFDTVRLPGVPVFMQKAGLAVGALLGRLCGYRSTYGPFPRRTALATV
jgi:quercetin dioxygenase-like cupin family protein